MVTEKMRTSLDSNKKRMVLALVFVILIATGSYMLGRSGQNGDRAIENVIARIFPSRTSTATQTLTPSLTPTITLTPSITPTPTCREISKRWVTSVFVPAYAEYKDIVSARYYDEWAEHNNAFVAIVGGRSAPQCDSLLVDAFTALKDAVGYTSRWYPDQLLGRRSTGYAFTAFSAAQRAIEELEGVYPMIIRLYVNK
jgi:hypothetical protein